MALTPRHLWVPVRGGADARELSWVLACQLLCSTDGGLGTLGKKTPVGDEWRASQRRTGHLLGWLHLLLVYLSKFIGREDTTRWVAPSSRQIQSLQHAFERQDLERHAQVLCRLFRGNKTSLMDITASHPLQDAWLDFSYKSLQWHFERARGFVYVAANDAMPGWLKVGKTQNLQQRLEQLNHAGVLGRTRIVFYLETQDRHWLETETHRWLKASGVENQKEFFKVSPEVVQTGIRSLEERDKQLFSVAGFYGR